jgi:SAM-dependent methyltransferase
LSGHSRFDRTAHRYADEARKRDYSELVSWCVPDAGDTALDVAAGPGFLSGALLPHVARAVAFDESGALLAHAPEGVEQVTGDADALPFDDESFDIVTCVHSLHHLPHPETALGEMARVLAPGGRLVVQDYLADPDPEQAAAWDEIERLRDPGHGRLLRRGEVAGLVAPRGLSPDDDTEWTSDWDAGRWISMVEPDEQTAARLLEMIGSDRFQLIDWRGRFKR